MSRFVFLVSLLALCTVSEGFRQLFMSKRFVSVLKSTPESDNPSVELVNPPLEEENVAISLRKWYLLKHRRRADVILESSASTVPEIVFEAWKAVLVSLRVMNTDFSMESHTSLVSFRKFPPSFSQMDSIKGFAKILENHLSESPEIFQANFQRNITFYLQSKDEIDWHDGPTLIMALDTARIDPEQIIPDDMDSFIPSLDNIVSNDIEGFPFDNVYDFISEVNRPPDPFTVTNLKFQFTIQDLKFDVSKLKNKKDPKEILLGINVRLTRLQKWRDVLTNRDNLVFTDSDMVDWSEKVKEKYRSLVSLVKLDRRRAMDSQYDKKKVFIDIIDKWSDRLKKVFKYTFISKNKPQDFMQVILDSNWRADITNTCNLIPQTPFLNMQGPQFIPGSPKSLYPHQMPVSRNFMMDQVVYEMLTWLHYIETAKESAGLHDQCFGSITQQVYSRALVSERAFYDTWLGLSTWLKSTSSTSSEGQVDADVVDKPTLLLNATAIVAELSSGYKDRLARDENSAARDHTDEFLETLTKINDFARLRSNVDARSVKELFKGWNEDGKEFIEWWTSLVRDLDLTDEMERRVSESTPVTPVIWSAVVDDVMKNKVEKVTPGALDDVNCTSTQLQWSKYRPMLLYAETIKATLPWHMNDEQTTHEDLISIPKSLKKELAGDTASLHFHPEASNLCTTTMGSNKKSLLVVLPRFFPGYGKSTSLIAQEMGAFLEFCRIIKEDVNALSGYEGNIQVVPMHPLLEDAEGRECIARRSPHPCIMFTIN
eukprot:gene8842-18321_t